jgi:hypothetical protein
MLLLVTPSLSLVPSAEQTVSARLAPWPMCTTNGVKEEDEGGAVLVVAFMMLPADNACNTWYSSRPAGRREDIVENELQHLSAYMLAEAWHPLMTQTDSCR